MSLNKVQEATTLGSVFGAPGDPNGGIFIGKLSGISGKNMRKRLLYPTYKNSSGKNQLVKNSLNEGDTITEEYLYNEEGRTVTEFDLKEMFGEALDKQTAFSGGKFVKIEPKCMAFPYCSQGAIDKPVKLISGTKEGMCESCHNYCSQIGEATGKSAEWVAEGFRAHTLKQLNEITVNDQKKVNQLLQAIEPKVDPSLFEKLKSRISMAIIDPYSTYDEILRKVKDLIPTIINLNESKQENKQTKNINEMIRVKNLSLQHRKEIMESILKSSVSECMQTKLQAEGFLPLNEELNGLTMDESLQALMEDDGVASEMFESLIEGSDDCAVNIHEWLKENNFLDAADDASDKTDETPDETPEVDSDTESNGDTDSAEDTTIPTDVPGDEAGAEAEPGLEPGQDGEGGTLELGVDAQIDADADVEVTDELQGLIDTLLQLQTKYAGKEEDSTKLSQVNDMLNQAKALKDQQASEIPAGTDIGDEISSDIEEETPESIAESFEGTTLDTATPAPVKKGAGGATRKPLDQDFIDKVGKFRDNFLDDMKWNSLKTYYNLSPEIQPEDIHAYLTPNGEENGLGFISRITSIQNDPTGINKMFVSLMNPAKRGYIEKFGSKYDPEFLEGLEDLMSDLFSKHLAIQNMLNGSHSPIEKDDDEDAEESQDGWNKDDFADDFETNDDDNIAAKAAAGATTKVNDPAVDIVPDEEEELAEGEESKPVMGDDVLSDNKSNAKETAEQAKDAEESQTTEDQKVDELKNQRFKASETQNTIADKLHGMNNPLDLDYDQEPSQDFKDRVLDQASGKAPADHANVDHDSTGGQALIDSAKARSAENEKQYTSVPDATVVKDDEKYKVTTAVNEEIERIKKLMKFDVTKLKENKLRSKVDEDKVLIERVQKKKFL